MNKFAAQFETMLYVFGQRLANRGEKGQTTAEYVGIVAFVAVLVIALIGLKTDLAQKVHDIIGAIFDKIQGAVG